MKKTIHIQNLKCGGCAATIQTKLSKLAGISNCEVFVETSAVTFDCESAASFKNAELNLAKLGYPASTATNNTATKLKSYVSCAVGKLKA